MSLQGMDTSDIKVRAIHSAEVGASAGLASYVLTPIFPEGHFMRPALWTGVADFIACTVYPVAHLPTRSAMVGAMMALSCKFLTRDCPTTGAMRYGVLAATAHFIGDKWILPMIVEPLVGDVESQWKKRV